MECPTCGFQNIPGLARCVRCQSAIDLAGVAVVPPRAARTPLGRARQGLSYRAQRARWSWARLERRLPRLPALPGELGWGEILALLVPGVGHIRAGRRRWGWALLLLGLAAVATALANAGSPAGTQAWTVALLVMCVALLTLLPVDWGALVCSLVLPGLGHLRRRSRRWGWGLLAGWVAAIVAALFFLGDALSWTFYALAITLHGLALAAFLVQSLRQSRWVTRLVIGVVVLTAVQMLFYRPVIALGGRYVAPMMVAGLREGPRGTPAGPVANGDILLFQPAGGAVRPWRRGDIVLYRMEQNWLTGGYHGGGAYSREGYGVDRIVALPGEHVAVRGGVLTVNGAAPPALLHPLGPVAGLPDFEFDVPPGHYGIVPSLLPFYLAPNALPATVPQLFAAVARVPQDHVEGRVWWRWSPLARFGRVE